MKNFPVTAVNNAKLDDGARPWFRVAYNAGAPVAEITIYDIIGKHPWDDSGIADREFAEALNGIPRGTKINLRINSIGGSVKDGLAIHNRIAERRADVTCYIDGMACSTASWIAIAASRVIIPENGQMMIHNPEAAIFAPMSASDLRAAADWLDVNKKSIISMYKSRTGKSEKEISDAMDAETWFVGAEAKNWGLADEVSKTVAVQNTFDLSRFRRVPGAISNTQHSARDERGGANNENTQMRDKIIALLKAHNIAFDEKATDEQLADLLSKVPAAQNQKPPASEPPPNNVINVNDLLKEVADIKGQFAAERKARITAAVDVAVNESRVPAAQRDNWVKRALADETVLNDLALLESRPPGAEPAAMNVEITSDSVPDLAKALDKCRKAINSWRQGNAIADNAKKAGQIIAAQALNFAAIFHGHREKLIQAMNANTISADLERTVILQDAMRAFAKNLIPLRVFSTVFNSVPLQASGVGAAAKIAVPFYPLVTDASTDWNGTNGYVMGDSVIEDREVTIDKRKYQPIRFGSDELNRSPFVSTQKIVMMKFEKLAYDVFTDVASIVTIANYGAAAFTGPASSFDSDDIADLGGAANTANWPKAGRALVVHTDVDTALRKDPAYKDASAFGGTEAIRGGNLEGVKLGGFEYHESVNGPSNAQSLLGWICLPQAAIVATSPILPDETIRRVLSRYDVVIDPQTGLAVEYRLWGNPDFDQRREVVEANYGYNDADLAALKRIASA